MLYSVAGGSVDPWAKRQMIRFLPALGLMLVIALIDVRVWLFLAYPIYALALALLIAVEFTGVSGMGAQRWIDLGVMQLQPSEVMKIAVVLALARYYHTSTLIEARLLKNLFMPLLLLAIPSYFVLRQPDLGTTLLIIFGGLAVMFAAGVRMWIFGAGLAAVLAAVPVVWQLLRPYQKSRVLTFLDPERDPLGAGYHIMQSKIALGSGGVFGKGFMQGTQSQLNFLPEKQTDFIFTMLAEEFGLIGALTLLGLYMVVLSYGVLMSFSVRSQFGRLLSLGVTTTLFLYVFINTAMVMGLLPVVGVPLPLMSYGGSAMMTFMVGMGLILSVALHRDIRIPRGGAFA
tara:strand:- start:1157 stop:2188 length:1032 start_codon:yes stop_codon:yes gene_type:complete